MAAAVPLLLVAVAGALFATGERAWLADRPFVAVCAVTTALAVGWIAVCVCALIVITS